MLDLGATIQSLIFQGTDVVLGFDSLDGYIRERKFLGATVGRFANRIADGDLTLDGRKYNLACNESDRHNHLHGGENGFDRRIWSCDPYHADDCSLTFRLFSPDGDEGYPGNLNVLVTMTLSEDDALTIGYRAETDKPTVINLTNHSYFNPDGCHALSVLGTRLRVAADEITEVDGRLIPTGRYLPVDGTPFDLRQEKQIADAVNADHPLIVGAGGLDHNFVLSHEKRRPFSEAASVLGTATGIRITCLTDLPGIQIYTSNTLESRYGKDGDRWGKYRAVCMETQLFPDAVHHPDFPDALLRPDEIYSSRTQYRLTRESLK